MAPLREEHCVPLSGNVPALKPDQVNDLLSDLEGWVVFEENGIPRLKKIYRFRNFSSALEFTTRIGMIAELEDHHPSLLTEWGFVTVSWWTHIIHGLHRNDFIMAARTDEIYQNQVTKKGIENAA